MEFKSAIIKLRAMKNPKIIHRVTETQEYIKFSVNNPKVIKPPTGGTTVNKDYVTSKQFDEFKDIVLAFIVEQREFNKNQLEFNKNIVSKNNLKT